MADIIPSADFEQLVKEEKKPLLIDVFGAGCAPCVWIAPVVDDLAKDLKDQARIVKLDRDEARENGGADNPAVRFMKENHVQGIPALLLFDQGDFKGALMGGPRSKTNVREWMEEKLGHAFNTAAAASPPCEKFGLVIENLPTDQQERFAASDDLYGQVSDIMVPFYATDHVQQIGVGPINADAGLHGITLLASREAVQALASALPGEKIIDATGKRIEATPKNKGTFFCVDDPTP